MIDEAVPLRLTSGTIEIERRKRVLKSRLRAFGLAQDVRGGSLVNLGLPGNWVARGRSAEFPGCGSSLVGPAKPFKSEKVIFFLFGLEILLFRFKVLTV